MKMENAWLKVKYAPPLNAMNRCPPTTNSAEITGPSPPARDLLFAALDAVPPRHLRIWPLARDLYRGGELDVEAASARADEFALATDEIRVVTAGTRRVNAALERWMDAA